MFSLLFQDFQTAMICSHKSRVKMILGKELVTRLDVIFIAVLIEETWRNNIQRHCQDLLKINIII